ncbi:aldolase [Arvimicrobium flavum]|uniref:3-oxo-tetronate 4-phosphate decarboxylase n=1 Tax=Arvimicrobium flavum TaxID=3393320 RepID=UPI00237AB0D9|nr:aldolase [Mesorhizobium shangrilense]
MSEQTASRDAICRFAASIFARGLTSGSSGNISLRLSDGGFLVTPTGSSLGTLDPARLTLLDAAGRYVSGDRPTKELPLHAAIYETRGELSGAVVHLHSTHSVGVSILPGVDPDCVFPPLTAYSVMRLGRVAMLPYFRPGDPAMADAVREHAGTRSAFLLAHHGPVVAGKTLDDAVNAMEEFEETARLMLLTFGKSPKTLSKEQVADLVTHFDVQY